MAVLINIADARLATEIHCLTYLTTSHVGNAGVNTTKTPSRKVHAKNAKVDHTPITMVVPVAMLAGKGKLYTFPLCILVHVVTAPWENTLPMASPALHVVWARMHLKKGAQYAVTVQQADTVT